ncbi:MAG: DtxR family transcriptional regulator [Oscillospiraceae bacterium]|nr:DtxR family transcriptional regulator [Oscillospiraceae bacterium]
MGKEAEQEFYTVRGYQLLEQHRAHLTPSLEDYLEMICRRIQEDGSVKAVALAEWLNVQPPSVSRMLRRLAQLQLVEYQKYGVITMTEQGREIGKYLLWRHDTVHRFLRLLRGGHGQDSLEEAELVEHGFSRETVGYLSKLTWFLKEHEEEYAAFLKMFPENK